jgi:diguanylate cyclase
MTAMPVTYQTWLVLLSIVMAIQGAYVGFSLAAQIAEANGTGRRLLLAGGTASLAVAIWIMHFIGMLAVRLPFQVDYLVLPTLLSFLICTILVGAAVYATSSGPPTLPRLTLSSCLMGGGIFAMHYIGMNALDASTYMVQKPVHVAASMAVAIAGSGLALWLATRRGGRSLTQSSAAFGVAVSGMYYTAMTGASIYPSVTASSGAPALSTDLLAIVVAVVAFCISGIFLLLLLPDSSRTESHSAAVPITAIVPHLVSEIAAIPSVMPAADGSGSNQLGRGAHAPLGGAGAPPRRFAQHLPIERDGSTRLLAAELVVAVQAYAHYTYIFDGNSKLFCPLAIGDVESQLDSDHFVRVHRSHIVKIDCVVGYRRSGDNELVEMSGNNHYSVPVSRSRIASLKSRVAALNGDDTASAPRRRHRFAVQQTAS